MDFLLVACYAFGDLLLNDTKVGKKSLAQVPREAAQRKYRLWVHVNSVAYEGWGGNGALCGWLS